jgi:hypothetical protein
MFAADFAAILGTIVGLGGLVSASRHFAQDDRAGWGNRNPAAGSAEGPVTDYLYGFPCMAWTKNSPSPTRVKLSHELIIDGCQLGSKTQAIQLIPFPSR